ncbi:hypothetical protein ACWC4D_29675 [Streptomyces sp. NPDC001288]
MRFRGLSDVAARVPGEPQGQPPGEDEFCEQTERWFAQRHSGG